MTLITVRVLLMLFATSAIASLDHGGFLAPLEGLNARDIHPNEYVVIFWKNHTLEQHFQVIGRNLTDTAHYRSYSFGYQATMDDHTRDEQVRRDPGVRMVETNGPAYGIVPDEILDVDESSELLPTSNTTSLVKRNYLTYRQDQAPYGLQIVGARGKLNTPVKEDGDYDWEINAGRGVNVYVFDTGIRTTHKDFEGRARHFEGLQPEDQSPFVDSPMQDIRGHGTHVAGIVGARRFGVAPRANLINVKVIDDEGNLTRDRARIAEALNRVIAEHNRNKAAARNAKDPWAFRGSVINMSFSWVGSSMATRYQIIYANDVGISIFAAAGNANEDETDVFPCNDPQVKCVAGIDENYHKYKASNFGPGVDYVAPARRVQSTYVDGELNRQTKFVSGTSQASPHAAGAAAIFASWRGLVTKRDLSQNFVWENSLDGLVTGFKNTATHLVNTGIHSPLKYPHEPFRWATDNPARNHAIDDDSDAEVLEEGVEPATPTAASEYLTTYTAMSTITLPAVTGEQTMSGVESDMGYMGTDSPLTASATSFATVTSSSSPTPTCATSGTPFAQPPVQPRIDDFCSSPYLDETFVPYIAFGNATTQTGQTKSLYYQGDFSIEGSSDRVWMRVRPARDGCIGSFNGKYQCLERFSTILNGCQTDTTEAKLGGELWVGCAGYALTVVDEHTDPFKVDREAAVGDFTCEDAVPAEGGGMFEGTCNCWMSARPDQTAYYTKPSNGVCDGDSVDERDGLVANQGY